MSTVPGSISQLIAEAKDGDEHALAKLHQRYWPGLVDLARSKLGGAPLRDRDAEDVAQNAFFSFYQSLKKTGFPKLDTRHQLLALLTHIVACKAANDIKHELTQKRGGGRVRNVSPLLQLAESDAHSPVEEAILHDCYVFYLGALPAKLKPIAELHLAGFTNAEIAERMGCVERTVERKIALLRVQWKILAGESVNKQINELLAG